MPKNPQAFADLLGARIVGEVPEVSGGPFGMAQLADLLHRRLTPGRGERPGRPTDSSWVSRPKVPMSAATQRRLAEMAEEMSTPERRVSPMQVAAQLLEEAVGRVRAQAEASMEQSTHHPEDLARSRGQEPGQGRRPRSGTSGVSRRTGSPQKRRRPSG
jgi:hypothetical protein